MACQGCSWSELKIVQTFSSHLDKDKEALKVFKDHGVIPKTRVCGNCGRELTVNSKGNYLCHRRFRPDPKSTKEVRCNFYASQYKDTWLDKTKMSASVNILLINSFLTKFLNQEFFERNFGVSSRTVVEWKRYCGEVCVRWLQDQAPIGGPGTRVEVDEREFGERNQRKGRRIGGMWVFGGVERGTKRHFIVQVEQRDAGTLLPLCRKYILPGTTIYSGDWQAYSGLSDLGLDYDHQVVNHSQPLVDPEVHTNTIESLWKDIENLVPQAGNNKERYKQHFARAIFCYSHPDHSTIFHHFLREIARCYPPPQQSREDETDTMEGTESVIRIPAVLMPSYNRLISTEEGKSAMKRIRVECGVCKATRFYSVSRGITRIAGVVACEGCRQFYQRFKKQPRLEHCDKGGRCFLQEEMPKKCKACGMAQILTRCPVPASLYTSLLNYLPTELKKRMPDHPPGSSEVPEERRGGLGLEVYKGDTWEDVTDRAEMQALGSKGEEETDADDPNIDDLDMEFEEMVVDDPEPTEPPPSEAPPSPLPPPPPGRVGRPKKSKQNAKNSLVSDQQIMASMLEGLKVNNQFMGNFNPKTSERMRRKKKHVQYFNSSGRGRGAHPSAFHGPNGCLVASGKDLCDCLMEECDGCHFPCSKCGSGKCGKECRINRKWYYDKVEVEGTTISWNNNYVKKM